ncbi:MAG: signal peptidase II [Actinomycetota bacterium]
MNLTSVLGRRRLVLAVAVVIVVIDQLSKWWALERLDDGRTIDVVWTFRFKLAFNSGTAFSQGEGLGWLIGIVALAMSVVLLVWGGRVASVAQRIAIGGVLGGAVGNLLDRAVRGDDGLLSGAVVDFFDLQWWPIFNVADIGITVGVVVLVVLLAREDVQASRAAAAAGPTDGDEPPAADPAGPDELADPSVDAEPAVTEPSAGGVTEEPR